MDYRRWCSWAEWGLVAAVVGLHGVILLLGERWRAENLLLTVVSDVQCLTVIVLIAAWALLGPGRGWMRLLIAPVMAGAWLLVAKDRLEATGAFTAAACASLPVAIGLRAAGFRVARLPVGHRDENGVQFSLAGLIVSTTMIATAIGLLEWLRPTLSATLFALDGQGVAPNSPAAAEIRTLVIGAAVLFAAIGGLWAVMRPGAAWLRLGIVAVLIPVSGLYLVHLAGVAGDLLLPATTSLAIGLAAVAGLCGVSVLPVRAMGYRLVGRSRSVAAVRDEKLFTLARASG